MKNKKSISYLAFLFIILIVAILVFFNLKNQSEKETKVKKENQIAQEEKANEDYKPLKSNELIMEVKGKKYYEKDIENLKLDTYEKQSKNEIILREILKELSTDKEKETVKTSSLVYQANKKMTKSEIKELEENTLINLTIQRLYEKYLNISEKEYKKEMSKNINYNSNLQIIINPNLDEAGRNQVTKELRKELDKLNSKKKVDEFYDLYSENHEGEVAEKDEERLNKYLEGNIIVDFIGLHEYNKDLFENAYYLKKYSYVKIGQENYTGFLFMYDKQKMTKEEIKEKYFEYRLLKSEYTNTLKMLNKIKEEEKEVKITEKAYKNIQVDWE